MLRQYSNIAEYNQEAGPYTFYYFLLYKMNIKLFLYK